MFGQDDDHITYSQIATLIQKWEAKAENERKAAMDAKRNDDDVMAEGCFGGLAVYRTCLADLRKLIG